MRPRSGRSVRFTACTSTPGRFAPFDGTPLTLDNVVRLRDRAKPYQPPSNGDRFRAYLGIDVGSVSTNLVLVNEAGDVVFDSYLRTAGRPMEAVQQGLAELQAAWGHRHRGRRASARPGPAAN